jgi:hypothetical protein
MELFACSGPGAGLAIGENVGISLKHAAVMGELVLVSVCVFTIGPRRRVVPIVLICMLVLHPAWWISALRGDCGEDKRDYSRIFTAIGSAALFWQVGRSLWNTASPSVPFAENSLRLQLECLSEQQRDAIRQLARSGRAAEAIQKAEHFLGITLGASPVIVEELQR